MKSSTATPPAAATLGVFHSTISTMSNGRKLTQIEDALRDAVRAAVEAGTKSKVNIELTISPNGVGVGDTPLFKVTAKVKKTLPEKADTASVYFADDEGNLTRRNPRQEEMKLSMIDGALAEVPAVGGGMAKAAGAKS